MQVQRTKGKAAARYSTEHRPPDLRRLRDLATVPKYFPPAQDLRQGNSTVISLWYSWAVAVRPPARAGVRGGILQADRPLSDTIRLCEIVGTKTLLMMMRYHPLATSLTAPRRDSGSLVGLLIPLYGAPSRWQKASTSSIAQQAPGRW